MIRAARPPNDTGTREPGQQIGEGKEYTGDHFHHGRGARGRAVRRPRPRASGTTTGGSPCVRPVLRPCLWGSSFWSSFPPPSPLLPNRFRPAAPTSPWSRRAARPSVGLRPVPAPSTSLRSTRSPATGSSQPSRSFRSGYHPVRGPGPPHSIGVSSGVASMPGRYGRSVAAGATATGRSRWSSKWRRRRPSRRWKRPWRHSAGSVKPPPERPTLPIPADRPLGPALCRRPSVPVARRARRRSGRAWPRRPLRPWARLRSPSRVI